MTTAPMPSPLSHHKAPRRWPVVCIGIGKLLKAAGLVIASFVLQALISPEEHKKIMEWLNSMRLEPHNWFIHAAAEKVFGLRPETLKILHIGVIIYAGLYLIEGLGLLWDKKWAEWMVVVTTAGFLPLELYEIWEEMTWGRCLLFAANIVVMIYLCWRLRRLAVVNREKKLEGVVVTLQKK